jgi:hypothetical protein
MDPAKGILSLAITIVFVGELAVCRYTFLDMASVSITHIDTKFSQIYIVY